MMMMMMMMTSQWVKPEEMTQRHKVTDVKRILGTDAVAIAGSTPTSTTTPNAAEDPVINQTTPTTPLHPKTTRLAHHHLASRIHHSILRHATQMGHFSQALDDSCHLKKENCNFPLRIIHSTEASCGAHLQATEEPTENKTRPLMPMRFTLSSPLRLQTRASGPTIITSNGVTKATEDTVTGATGKGRETGDGIHLSVIWPTSRMGMLNGETAGRSRGSTNRGERGTPGTIQTLLPTSPFPTNINKTTSTRAGKVSTNISTPTTSPLTSRTTLQIWPHMGLKVIPIHLQSATPPWRPDWLVFWDVVKCSTWDTWMILFCKVPGVRETQVSLLRFCFLILIHHFAVVCCEKVKSWKHAGATGKDHFYTNSFTKTEVFVFLSIFSNESMHLYDVYIAVLQLHSACFKSFMFLCAHIYLYVTHLCIYPYIHYILYFQYFGVSDALQCWRYSFYNSVHLEYLLDVKGFYVVPAEMPKNLKILKPWGS